VRIGTTFGVISKSQSLIIRFSDPLFPSTADSNIFGLKLPDVISLLIAFHATQKLQLQKSPTGVFRG
jgi:hypothetical protein